MSDETTAPEADENAAPDAELTQEPNGESDGTSPEPAEPEATDEAEPAEGGVLEDHERKPAAAPGEVSALRAGETRITREQLAEINLRRAQHDITTLIAACGALLDELEDRS